MDIIDKINLLLSEKGVTGAEMSRAIGLSTAVYSQWNTRNTKPSKKNIKKVADYFGVSVEYLLSLDDNKKEKPATTMGDELTPDRIKLLLPKMSVSDLQALMSELAAEMAGRAKE